LRSSCERWEKPEIGKTSMKNGFGSLKGKPS